MEPKQLMMGPIFWEDQIIFKRIKTNIRDQAGCGNKCILVLWFDGYKTFHSSSRPQASLCKLMNRNYYQGIGQKQHFVFSSLSSSPHNQRQCSQHMLVEESYPQTDLPATGARTQVALNITTQHKTNLKKLSYVRRKISRGMEYVLLYRISIFLLSLQCRFKTK